MKIKNLISVLMVIFLLPLVSAALIPNDAPCWYTGTVSGTDITAEGLTVEAYKGNTLLKSSVISNGTYNLNSVGANDGDIINLKVYGATFVSSTFVGFCKTGNDPFVVEDFTISKQANGVSCNNNAICISGLCSSNVCSSGGGGGSSRTTTDNTSTTESSSSSSSDGTSSSSGGSSSGNGQILVEVPGINTIQERNDLISEVTLALDIDTNQIESIQEVSISEVSNEVTLTEEEMNSELNNNQFPLAVQNVINEELKNYDSVKLTVKKKFKIMKVIQKDGTEKKVTKIEKEIFITSKDLVGKTIRIVEVIPKEVASSANKISGSFTVLEEDPVILFEIPTSSVIDGKVKIDYTISGEVSEKNLNKIITTAGQLTEVVVLPEVKTQDTTTPNVENNVQPDTTEKTGLSFGILLTIIILLVVIVGAVIYLTTSNPKKKD